MKTWARGAAAIAAVSVIAVLPVGCRAGFELPEAGSPQLCFYLADTGLRLGGAGPLIDHIELTGRGPKGAEFSLAPRTPFCSVPNLCTGTWGLSACAVNCQGVVAAEGAAEFHLERDGPDGNGAFNINLYGADAHPSVGVTVSSSGLGELDSGLAGEIEVQIAPFSAVNEAVPGIGPAPFSFDPASDSTTSPQEHTLGTAKLVGFGRAYVLSAQIYADNGDTPAGTTGRTCIGGDASLFRVVPGLTLHAEILVSPAEGHTQAPSLEIKINPLSVYPEPAEILGISPPLFAGRPLSCRSDEGSGLWYLDGRPLGRGAEISLSGEAAPSEGLHRLTFLGADGEEEEGAEGADSFSGAHRRIGKRTLEFLTPVRVGPMVLTQLYRRGERYPTDEFISGSGSEPTGLCGLRGLSVSPDGRCLAAAGYSSDALLIFLPWRPVTPADPTDVSGGSGMLQQVALARDSPEAPLDGISDTAFLPGPSCLDTELVVAAAKNSSALTLWRIEEAAGGQAELELLDAQTEYLAGVCAIAPVPGSLEFYCCSEDSGTLSMWSAETGEALVLKSTFTPPPGCEGPTDIALSPDGLWAAAAYKDSDSVCIFSRDPGSGNLIPHTIFEDETGDIEELNGVHQLTFHGNHLYTSSFYDDAVCLFTLEQETDNTAWQFAGSWEEFGTVSEPQPEYENGAPGECGAEYKADIGTLNYTQGLAVSPDGGWVAVCAGSNDALCLWKRDLVDGSLQPAAAIQEGAVQEGAEGLPGPLPGFSGPLEGLDSPRTVLWAPQSSETDPLTLYCAASNSNALLVLEEW